jgi:hypothetical protein
MSLVGTKPSCPECSKNDYVYVVDKGIKFLYRLLLRNNRFACGNCKITWRKNDEMHTERLHTKKTKVMRSIDKGLTPPNQHSAHS